MEPLTEYSSRKERAESARELLKKRSGHVALLRLATAAIFILALWAAEGAHAVSAWVLWAPAAAFIALLIWHRSVRHRQEHWERVANWYGAGINRINDEWMKEGDRGDEFRDPQHPYADDLDVFGEGSLFQLISRARTALGRKTLANWFLNPASTEEAVARQNAAQELAGRTDFVERLALAGAAEREKLNIQKTIEWAGAKPVPLPPRARFAALLLALAGIGTGLAVMARLLPLFVFAAVFALDALCIFALRKQMETIAGEAATSARQLRTVAALVTAIEQERFEAAWLRQVQAALRAEGARASEHIFGLARRLDLLESSEHILLRLLNPVLLWREQTALAVEAWRTAHGRDLGRWLTAVGEFEAAHSLAVLTFERPDWCFPSLEASGAHFAAQDLRHPLLPASRAVGNDVAIGPPALLIVSGSNMSGKSTLLRSVGLGVVLGFAGAPVPAQQVTMGRLQVGASMRSVDSLQDNRSRFLAEITRMRQILDLTKASTPVLYLLDELLSGTNSHDRRIGAGGILKSLIAAGAIGIVTTHDLALTAIADEVSGAAKNVHFEDQFEAGEFRFDYRLKPGVVTRSNALALMRAVGLEIL